MTQTAFKSYALLGSGKVARHVQQYLRFLNLPFRTWTRSEGSVSLQTTVQSASHVLFAVSDGAIANLAQDWLSSGKTLVHFSGALNIPGLHAAHPLMTFGSKLEERAWYEKIPFVLDTGDTLADLLPGLPNPFCTLPPEQRALYHALCTLAGNFSSLLWRQIGDRFEQNLGMPRALLTPFLQQCAVNSAAPTSQLTGPVVRGDWGTVKKHLSTLNSDPSLHAVYQSYLQSARSAGFAIPEDIK